MESTDSNRALYYVDGNEPEDYGDFKIAQPSGQEIEEARLVASKSHFDNSNRRWDAMREKHEMGSKMREKCDFLLCRALCGTFAATFGFRTLLYIKLKAVSFQWLS